jgi:ABC-2 type transport system ATP-binding protein
LDLRPGARTVIVGGNGSGKSTLLRIAAGVTHPTAGSVIGSDAVGYVPERLPARSKFTGAEYVTHMGRIRGLDSETVESRSRELFERLDLQPGPTVTIDALSKGNKQKLILAQAFLALVGLLVLDEPFSGLDTTARNSLDDLMDEAQGRGTSILISAHRPDPTLAADRMFQVGSGHLEPLSVPQAPDFVVAEGEQRIELIAGRDMTGYEQLATLPGVRAIRTDALRIAISLVVESRHTGSLLTAAVRLGWSVESVSAPGRKGDR